MAEAKVDFDVGQYLQNVPDPYGTFADTATVKAYAVSLRAEITRGIYNRFSTIDEIRIDGEITREYGNFYFAILALQDLIGRYEKRYGSAKSLELPPEKRAKRSRSPTFKDILDEPRSEIPLQCEIGEKEQQTVSDFWHFVDHDSEIDALFESRFAAMKRQLAELTIKKPAEGEIDVLQRLKVDSDEYAIIASSIFQEPKIRQIKIIKIEKVMNRRVVENYEAKKAELLATFEPSALNSGEQFLYYGTKRANVDGITRDGFMYDVGGQAGERGAAYGACLYFSNEAVYSLDARYSPDGNMILAAKVFTGQSTAGDEAMKQFTDVPFKDPERGIRFDSLTVDFPGMGRYFMVFNGHQACPAFVLTAVPQRLL